MDWRPAKEARVSSAAGTTSPLDAFSSASRKKTLTPSIKDEDSMAMELVRAAASLAFMTSTWAGLPASTWSLEPKSMTLPPASWMVGSRFKAVSSELGSHTSYTAKTHTERANHSLMRCSAR